MAAAMKVTFNVVGYHDRRTAELRRYGDSIDEKLWRVRVAANEARRVLRGQAGLQSVHVRTMGEVGTDRGPAIGANTEARSPFTLVSVRSVRDGWTTLQRLREGQEQ